MNEYIQEKIKEFDIRFPLQGFATENYTGKVDEFEFTQWNEQQTKLANTRREFFRTYWLQSIEDSYNRGVEDTGNVLIELKTILEKIRLREYDIQAESMRDGKVYNATTESWATIGLKLIDDNINKLKTNK